MDRRTYIKLTALAGIGALAMPPVFSGRFQSPLGDEIVLPELPYSYDALEPYIDAKTMEIHHSKHHAGYTKKYKTAVEENGLEGKPIDEIFSNVSVYPDNIRNNGGGFYNHKLYWEVMSPDGGGEPKGSLAEDIKRDFGSFERFKETFSTAAATQFGSGWAWLIITGSNKLKVVSTPNQDNPLMDIAEVKGSPLLCLDVWEHAYYLNYQNRRKEYIENFWNVVNWEKIELWYKEDIK